MQKIAYLFVYKVFSFISDTVVLSSLSMSLFENKKEEKQIPATAC
jgi:hypothetical protein